jgi:hypothetical protein
VGCRQVTAAPTVASAADKPRMDSDTKSDRPFVKIRDGFASVVVAWNAASVETASTMGFLTVVSRPPISSPLNSLSVMFGLPVAVGAFDALAIDDSGGGTAFPVNRFAAFYNVERGGRSFGIARH